jgi:phosphoglycerate dehydrogenase-like enzyme
VPVLLAAHEYSDEVLRTMAASISGCWVHLVSAGIAYPGLGLLREHNLVTRTWRAYRHPLREYVLNALLEVEWAGGYPWSSPDRSAGRGLFGKHALVLGYGHIARAIARVLAELGVTVSVLRRRQPTETATAHYRVVTRAQVHGPFDYMVLALPEAPDTDTLVDEGLLATLRPGGHLVNVGRGRTLDHRALAEAVRERRLWATLDVTDPEPLPDSHELRRLERVRISPHIAWQSGNSELCFLEDWAALRASLVQGTLPEGADPWALA